MIKYLFLNLKQNFLYYRKYKNFKYFLNKVVLVLKNSTTKIDYKELYESVSNKKYLKEYIGDRNNFTVDVKRKWYSKKIRVTFNSYIFSRNLILALNYLQECGYIEKNSYYYISEIEIKPKLDEDTFEEISKDINNYRVVPNFKYYSY